MPKVTRQDRFNIDRKVTDFFPRRLSTSSSPAKSLSTPPVMPAKSRQSASSSAPVPRASSRTTKAHPSANHVLDLSSATVTTRSAMKLSSDNSFGTVSPPTNSRVLRKSSNKRTRMQGMSIQPVRGDVTIASPSKAAPQAATIPNNEPLETLIHDDLADLSPHSSRQVVDSSQSDEVELVLPLCKSRDSLNLRAPKRRRVTLATPDIHRPMEVDAPDFSPDTPMTPIHSFVLPLATDEASSLPLPATPKALDGETKAAKLIADIRARAFASANFSSEEDKPLQYRDLDDSDDDELEISHVTQGDSSLHSGSKNKCDIFSSPLTSLPSSTEKLSYCLRSRHVTGQSSPSPSPSRPSRRSERLPKAAPLQLPRGTVQKISPLSASSLTCKVFNPLHALLREKRAADKRGTSSAALHLAENNVRQGGREPFIDPNYGKSDHLSLMDEEVAWHRFQALSPQADQTGIEDYILGPRHARMLGSDAGAAITKILADDKVDRGKAKERAAQREKALGVSLWITEPNHDMDVGSGSTFTNASFGHGSVTLDLMTRLYRIGDDAQLALLLESGAIIKLPSQQLAPLVSSLFVIGLFSSACVANASHNALRDVYTAGISGVVLSFSVICTALIQLGARFCVFEQVGWHIESCPQDMHLTSEIRSEVLLRLVAAIKLAATSAALANDDVANHVLGLVLIGLDNTSCHVLRTELNSAIDAICTYNATDLATRASIHARILDFAAKLNPVNKARLVTFFSSGGSQTRHIAQWLAYCLLMSSSAPLMDQLPQLDSLIVLLSPPPESGQLFDVTCENTDYEDLGHYVSILAVALTNIAPYIKDERSVPQQSSITSMDGSPGKVKNNCFPLERLRLALEAIHGRIVDTRAAHLDRSRVKAALQRLTMRLYFEHHAIKRTSLRGHTSTLQEWFSPRH